jgi:hypothetical protein
MMSNPISGYWRGRKEIGIMEFKSNEMSIFREKSNENGRIIVGGVVQGKKVELR